MDDKPLFAKDLFQGTAEYYDRYRRPYPDEMITELGRRAAAQGSASPRGGRVLDLACGTGQLAFALRPWFSEVWAVDQEPDMVTKVRVKAGADAAGGIRAIGSSAEVLEAEPGYFDLVVIGNAFHRLDRDLVAGRVFEWLKPGGYLALCWSSQPFEGDADWQRPLWATLARWRTELGVESRIPANWDAPRKLRPDGQVLADAGFEVTGKHRFAVEQEWTVADLCGLVRSTSFLSAPVLADRADEFDADLAAIMTQYGQDGVLTEAASYECELARKPSE
jgi:ubiquinone/menaquinone biosynthesis C-methylase UbiE